MKKNLELTLCIVISILACSCSNEQLHANIQKPNDNLTTVTSVSTASELSDNDETTYQSEIEPVYNKVDTIIDFITNKLIYHGSFYDFDKDGIPELVEAVAGIDDCTYNIYSLAYDEPEYIGMLLADSYSDV